MPKCAMKMKKIINDVICVWLYVVWFWIGREGYKLLPFGPAQRQGERYHDRAPDTEEPDRAP